MGVHGSGSRTAVAALIGVAASLLLARPGHAQVTGVIEGRLTTTVAAPTTSVPVTTDAPVCGPSVPDESLVVDPSGGVAHAVVTLVGVPALAPTGPVIVANRGCRFVPRVQIARPGDEIAVTSEDNTLHTTHAYAAGERSLFNVAIPMPGLTVTRPLATEGVVRLACDTHTWMRGYVVTGRDRAVVTAADGTFQIQGVPPGTYEIRVWHERLETPPQRVTVAAGATATVAATLVESALAATGR